jgi:hypothetical protein
MPRRVTDVVTYGKSIVTAMTGNASFPTPNPPLATFEADLDGLSVAEAAVLARTKGAAQVRNVKLATVHADFKAELAYVQQVATANPSSSAAIITVPTRVPSSPRKKLPLRSIGHVLAMDCTASNTLTRERLGWHPTQAGLIRDLEHGRYFENGSAP